ncbi:hypothetical protein BBP40_002030 [Aspergillus hancockii]|nr:hypothetical protein BBP40_002030 [Aspergillus hancockii]
MTGTRTIAFATASDIFGPSTEPIAAEVQSQLYPYAEQTANQNNGAIRADDLRRLFDVQHDLIFSHNVSMADFVFIFQGTRALHTGYWGLLPFARGHVHIVSDDPRVLPAVNTNFEALGWEDMFDSEILSGLGAVPENASDEAWKETPNYHAIGTTSMLPRSMGGVVDSRLMVYGATNVRVADASIQPMQLSGHPMSKLYAIAERVADFIKTDQTRA